ncbi:MAG: hypothetical protein LKE64_05045 [Solobacterium sp.]|jgi:hypothetical protein|nr:hypothetical protein [Solobacterium sp.]MCH4050297.1 hypothetical protein [Solobacterium sp.]MCH4075746.1 hypothetical protein [Solobacterium sp.]MCI1312871.1 hypothetical protein [Solobacterium sp.]MCI1345402.1 hypothetical protein [Solobacterium sp.]
MADVRSSSLFSLTLVTINRHKSFIQAAGSFSNFFSAFFFFSFFSAFLLFQRGTAWISAKKYSRGPLRAIKESEDIPMQN